MFKQIPFGAGNYYINEEGEVLNSNTGKIKKWYYDRNGYPILTLSCRGFHKKCFLHRLIAQAFIPNPNNYPVVLHKDNNPANFSISNLKWGTQSENVQQAYDDGIGGGQQPLLYQIYKDDSPVYIEKTGMAEIANRIRTTRQYAYGICRYQTPIQRGPFRGWFIKKAERSTIIR